MKTKNSFLALLILLVILGCSVPDETIGTASSNSHITSVPNETTGTTPSNLPVTSQFSPLSVDLIMEKAPRLNEVVTLTCTVKSTRDAPDTAAIIKLPQEAVVISGNLDWRGDLTADIPIQFSANIKFVKEGEFEIEADATHMVDEGWGWRNDDSMWLDIGADVSRFYIPSAQGFAKPDPTYQPQPGEIPPKPLPDPKSEGVLPPEQ